MSKFFPSDLPALAKHLITNGPRKVHPTSRRVRVLFNHAYIVDTTSAVHVWEHDGFPQFYVPRSALQNCKSNSKDQIKAPSGSVGAEILDIHVPGPEGGKDQSTDRAIYFHGEEKAKDLAGLVRLEFGSMDAWLEEDTPIYVHPKDPFKRLDLLPSTRPLKVSLHGHTLAETSTSIHLLETSLPTRYYIPLSAVNQAYLRPSSTTSKCPYKGTAEYYDVALPGKEVARDLVWYYRVPTLEAAGVAGMVCFYNEKVDIALDGKELERPVTFFS